MRGARRTGVVVLCGFVTLGTPFVGGILKSKWRNYFVVGERNTEQIKRDLPNSPNIALQLGTVNESLG